MVSRKGGKSKRTPKQKAAAATGGDSATAGGGKRGQLLAKIRAWQDGSRIRDALEGAQDGSTQPKGASMKRPASAPGILAEPSGRRDRNANTHFQKLKSQGMLPPYIDDLVSKVSAFHNISIPL